MEAVPTDGVRRLLFVMDNRLAQLRWTREDLAAAGGPAPSTLRYARRRGGGLTRRTLARLDFALGWQEGSAQNILAGQNPSVSVSAQIEACCANVDAALRHADCTGVTRCADELRNFLLTVAQRLGDFYTDPVRTGEDTVNAGAS
jgi:hypothetical protein